MTRKTIYKHENKNFKPLKPIEKKDLKGWEIGNLTILCKNPSKKLRNMICAEKNLKKLMFGKKN